LSSSFDWADYLAFARDVRDEDCADEACQRSAVSRAYYAAFHAASAYLLSKQETVQTQGGDSHAAVWTALKSGRWRKPKAAARADGLKRARIQADYRTEFSGDLTDAVDKAIRDAEFILTEVK
jgi:uncharacterized protein (UPF0332 family)